MAADPVAVAILVALVIHALAGEPTPDRPAMAALLTGGLLAVAVGGALWCGRDGPLGPAPWRWPALGLVAGILALPPLAMAARHGWAAPDIVRDVVPLAALFAPALLWSGFARRDDPAPARRCADALLLGLVAVGVGHAGRFLLAVEAAPGTLGVAGGADGERYLANGPAVVFAAVALTLGALAALRRPRPGALLRAGGLAMAALPCVLVLAMTLQRAALGAGALTVGAVAIGWALRRPRRAALLLVGGGLALMVAGAPLVRLALSLAAKTVAVGTNSRTDELVATFAAMTQDPAAALFGQGWGAVIALPAIATAPVSFVHVLPLYLGWKAGLLGLIAGTAWLGALVRPIRAALARHPIETAAVLAALMVATTVQPGFKTLAFALILSLPILRAHTIEGRD